MLKLDFGSLRVLVCGKEHCIIREMCNVSDRYVIGICHMLRKEGGTGIIPEVRQQVQVWMSIECCCF